MEWILKIKQAGDKYGSYLCPVCGSSKTLYKFSQNLGHCESCGKIVAHCRGAYMHDSGDKAKSTHWINCSLAG